MANKIHLALLERGVEDWNEWRKNNPHITPNLCGADLHNKDLSECNFKHADLRNAQLRKATIKDAEFYIAKLQGADLTRASIIGADFTEAKLQGAIFRHVTAFDSSISYKPTKFIGAEIQETDFTKANLNSADFTRAKAGFFNLLGDGHLWIMFWSVLIGFWSAFPAFVMLTFYMYFFGFFKRKLYLILLASTFVSISWAIFIRFFFGKIYVGFTGFHIAIGTGMIFLVVVSEIVTIKLSRSQKNITAKFWSVIAFVSLIILVIFDMQNLLTVVDHNIEANDPSLSNYKAIFGAFVGVGYGAWVSNLAIKGEEFSLLWRIYVEDIASLGTSFKHATLDDAFFNDATLTGANFTQANINRTSWWSVDDLDFIVPGDKYLKYSQIRNFFQLSTASGNSGRKYQLNCDNLNLEGINFSHQQLNNSSFWGANFSNSSLSNTELENVILTGSNLNGADLTQATLTGASLKDIKYDNNTVFNNVKCKYINLHDRFPLESNFQDGDFENFFRKEDTLKLLIRHPYNIQAIDLVLTRIMQEYRINSNLFQGIRRLGKYLLIEFKVAQEVASNKTEIEQRFPTEIEKLTDYQQNREQEQSDDNQPNVLILKIIRTIIVNNGNYNEDIDGDYHQS